MKSLFLLLLALLQSQPLQTVAVTEPFAASVVYPPVASLDDSLYIVLDWAKVQPVEIAFLSGERVRLFEKFAPGKDGRLVYTLRDVLYPTRGVVDLTVSIRAGNGQRAVIEKIQVWLR